MPRKAAKTGTEITTPPKLSKPALARFELENATRRLADEVIERAMRDRIPALAPETYDLIRRLQDKVHELVA